MKTPVAPKEKPIREPRISCAQTNYSPTALRLMEKATGQRLTPLPSLPKVSVQAADAD